MTHGAGSLIDVAVNAGQPSRIPFSYRVPKGMCLETGQAVFVPFGSKVLQGVIVGVTPEAPEAELREVQSAADDEPVLDEAHIALARWMSECYLAPLWECIATCLPPGYGQRPVTMVSPVEIPALLPVHRRDQKILGYLAEHGRLTLESLREAVGNVPMARLHHLQERGYLTVTQGLARPRAGPRFERRLRRARADAELAAEAATLREGNPRSVDGRLLARLSEDEEITLTTARELGVTPKHVDRLEEQGWIEEIAVRIERDPVTAYEFNPRARPVLSGDQQAAVEAVWSAETPYLLHGVTGAGKTEVYLELAERTVAEGRSVIILVPEISLTPQAVRRYGERFGRRIGVVHSGLGEGELYDQWFRMHEGDVRLVLGSRSAIFAPVQNPGLIVIDEEHEPSYKQSDPQPRYHARAAAERLAQHYGAKLVLGSATPDIISYHRAERGEFGLATLSDRLSPDGGDDGFSTIMPPRVETADMREELRAGNRAVFSRRLVSAARSALSAGEQVLLFVNRRGSARFILCRDCGAVAECPTCGVAMSLQADEGALPRIVCHHCGRSRKLDQACPKCGSGRYRPFGVGTQRIEQEARRAFPGARVARWDSEAASRKGAHEKLVHGLEHGEIDVIVGTQVLAKGLDLASLTLVGVVDADVGLHLPSYQAPERSYQLLSQVIGRAGRRQRQGLAIIQTYDPEAPAIQAAARGDYEGFFEEELNHRRRAGYPPFSRLARLLYRDSNEERALEEATRVATELRTRRDAAGRADPDVLGPSPAYIRRLRGEYRWTLLLRGHDPAKLIEQVRLGRRWTVDIDPVNLL